MPEFTEDKPGLNRKFPACAYVARRMLAEVYGCKPGDVIPGEAELLAHARPVAESGSDGGKASYALAMVEEIGGIFEQVQRSGGEPKVPAHDLMLHAHQHDTPLDEPHEHPHTGPGHVGITHSHPHRHAPMTGEQQR